MASVGLVSKDVISKSRIMEVLKEKNYDCTNINHNVFDAAGFDLILVDLDDPIALLILKDVGYKCISFGSANDEGKLMAAKLAGCDRVYKHGEFFKKILPNLKI
jgi:hypothetical protein